ncbi:hypothetical protein BHM03_00011535 [Ensete ventricosum]|nr:hypothetical protein BHM03_00011535 [Ensete ventricosum]
MRTYSEVTTKVEEGSMSESCGGMTSKTSKSAKRCSLKLQQTSIQFKQHETIAILAHNKGRSFPSPEGSAEINKDQHSSANATQESVIDELKQHDGSEFDNSTTAAESNWESRGVLQPKQKIEDSAKDE